MFASLHVQVEQHFHVITYEAQWVYHDVPYALCLERGEVIADIRLQPGYIRWAGTALVHQVMVYVLEGLGYQSCGFLQLSDIVTVCAHRGRDAVRGIHDTRLCPPVLGNLCQGLGDPLPIYLDPVGVIVEGPDLAKGHVFQVQFLCSVLNVLPVLPAAGIGTVGRGHVIDAAMNTVAMHLLQGVAEVGFPVPVAPVYRQVDVVRLELGLQQGFQFPVLCIERAHAIEMFVVPDHLLHARRWDIFSPQDIVKKRPDIVHALGPTEGHNHDRVVLFFFSINRVALHNLRCA